MPGSGGMTWFKVDDGFHDHPKVQDAGAAVALWVLAGSWCARHLTDGWISESNAKRLLPDEWQGYAATLVEVGLWVPEARGGRPGYRFHDWHDMQPTRESVLAERARAAEKAKAWRERKKRERDGVRNPVRDPDSHGVSTRVPRAAVSRPDPTRPPLKGEGSGVAVAADAPEIDKRVEAVEDKPVDWDAVEKRMAARVAKPPPPDNPEIERLKQEMRAKLPPGRSLSRWRRTETGGSERV